jgi:predicted dehydrogenase
MSPSAGVGRRKIRWGVLGVARIATDKVIPATRQSACSEVVAIASRDLTKAQTAAAQLGIPKAYGSYEALLADPEIDAVYNPLPNHLHVPWSIRAAEAGKHVLCEKPIALNALEAEQLIVVRDRTGMKIQEAFMVHTHPQWTTTVDLIRRGEIGEVRSIAGVFSFLLTDPGNVRTVAEYGGGGLLDLGCYLVHTARWMLGREPSRVAAAIVYDRATHVDRVASMILEFPPRSASDDPVHAIGTCSMYQTHYQRVHAFGTRGRVEIEIPFNAPPDRPCRVFVADTSDPTGVKADVRELPTCNQYTIQADRFARAILDNTDVALPLEDSVKNMRVLDAVVRAARSGRWEELGN